METYGESLVDQRGSHFWAAPSLEEASPRWRWWSQSGRRKPSPLLPFSFPFLPHFLACSAGPHQAVELLLWTGERKSASVHKSFLNPTLFSFTWISFRSTAAFKTKSSTSVLLLPGAFLTVKKSVTKTWICLQKNQILGGSLLFRLS